MTTLRYRKDDLARTNSVLILAAGVGLGILLLRYVVPTTGQFATACMWAGSCLLSGSALGFLFGIPRVIQSPADAPLEPTSNTPAANGAVDYRQEVNSNLIEISDWLTKIVVGLGLVNLEKIPEFLDRSARTLAQGLSATSACQGDAPCPDYAFASALIVGFSVLGFFMGYLYTRLFLAGAFSRADRSVSTLLARTERILREESPDSEPSSTSDQIPEWQIRAAQRISELPQAQNRKFIVSALRRLATEYDRMRSEMASGLARTRKMTEILVRMRGLALAGYSDLPYFAKSDSPGERLVAVAMLQLEPDPAYFSWLVDRVSLEKPFVAYHALEVFRRALEHPDARYHTAVRETLGKWLKTEKAKDLLAAETDRTILLKTILRELDLSNGSDAAA